MKVSDYSLKRDIGHFTNETIYNKVRSKMRTCSVTVILIGTRTGYRKWIDWEIWASLRRYNHPYNKKKSFKPNGLLAFFLPCEKHSVPDRLQDNIDSGYAVCMSWENLEIDFESKVNYAYWKRNNVTNKIRNNRNLQENNSVNFFGIKI